MAKKRLRARRKDHRDYKHMNEFFDAVLKKSKEAERKVRNFKHFIKVRNSEEVLEDKEIKAFGSFGAHVVMPKKHIGKKATIIITK